MSSRVAFHNGFFRGLRLMQGNLPQRGCSLDFLAFLHERAERMPSAQFNLDPELHQLLKYYRESFKTKLA